MFVSALPSHCDLRLTNRNLWATFKERACACVFVLPPLWADQAQSRHRRRGAYAYVRLRPPPPSGLTNYNLAAPAATTTKRAHVFIFVFPLLRSDQSQCRRYRPGAYAVVCICVFVFPPVWAEQSQSRRPRRFHCGVYE